jgi:hypothetical protein
MSPVARRKVETNRGANRASERHTGSMGNADKPVGEGGVTLAVMASDQASGQLGTPADQPVRRLDSLSVVPTPEYVSC